MDFKTNEGTKYLRIRWVTKGNGVLDIEAAT